MKTILIEDTLQLASALSELPAETLFRGQTKNYTMGTGQVSMVSSFDRIGCIPSLMLKWSHYARFTLAPHLYPDGSFESIEEAQAILQHYGWRSFYLDFSSNPAVSSWFASHQYESKRAIEMTEDWQEDPVWRVHQTARYTNFAGDCHVYAVDPDIANNEGVHAHDLSSLSIADARPRFHAQDAWLLGPIAGSLSEDAITHHFIADAEVFREFSASKGITSVTDLFPPASEDPILGALLSVPWKRLHINDDDTGFADIPVFVRSLELPDYHFETRKRLGPEIALFDGFEVAEVFREVEGPHNGSAVFTIPSPMYFGRSDYESRPLPRISELVKSNPAVIFEIEELIRFPESGRIDEYGKGVFLEQADELISVSDLTVRHPNRTVTGVGVNAGWHYREESSSWTRVTHSSDCPCDNTARHSHHMSVLYRVEEALEEGNWQQIAKDKYKIME